jgi:hypothetical protein
MKQSKVNTSVRSSLFPKVLKQEPAELIIMGITFYFLTLLVFEFARHRHFAVWVMPPALITLVVFGDKFSFFLQVSMDPNPPNLCFSPLLGWKIYAIKATIFPLKWVLQIFLPRLARNHDSTKLSLLCSLERQAHHCSQLLVELEVSLRFFPHWPQSWSLRFQTPK